MLTHKLFSWVFALSLCRDFVSEELNTLLYGFKSCTDVDDGYVFSLRTSFYF